jgi:DNA-binding MarR family transcriptional regulator
MSRPAPPVRVDERLPPGLIESPLFVLMQAGRIAQEWTASALAVLELELVDFALMLLVNRLGPMIQTAIADRLGISEPALTPVAARLERQDLIQRQPHRFDGRRRLVSLTQAGEHLLADAVDELEDIQGMCLDHMGEEQCKRLASLAPRRLSPVEHVMSFTRDPDDAIDF